MTLRLARCPACGHEGGIPRDVPTTQRLRCSACGEKFLARNAIGERPCPLRRPSRETAVKSAAAREIIERYGDHALDDPIDDLFRGPPQGASPAPKPEGA